MNFIAHTVVALAITPGDDDYRAAVGFGAALPDLCTMARVRLVATELPGPVRAGVDLHHRTDAAFHADTAFRSGLVGLGESLRAAGIARGPSRAIAHAGWELLLDGCLLDAGDTERDFGRVLELAPDIAEAVAPDDPDRWRELVAMMASDRWWTGYRDPAVIAARLERVLRHRPRLAFPSAQRGIVAAQLAAMRPSVKAAAPSVVQAVREAVGGH